MKIFVDLVIRQGLKIVLWHIILTSRIQTIRHTMYQSQIQLIIVVLSFSILYTYINSKSVKTLINVKSFDLFILNMSNGSFSICKDS